MELEGASTSLTWTCSNRNHSRYAYLKQISKKIRSLTRSRAARRDKCRSRQEGTFITRWRADRSVRHAGRLEGINKLTPLRSHSSLCTAQNLTKSRKNRASIQKNIEPRTLEDLKQSVRIRIRRPLNTVLVTSAYERLTAGDENLVSVVVQDEIEFAGK